MYKTVLFIWASICSTFLGAQAPDYKMTSMDEEFTIELVREEKTVKVIIQFAHPENYAHAVVERLMGEPSQFRQCVYIDLKTQKAKDGIIVVHDLHPSKFTDESLYRLRTVSLENIERVYSSLRLPPGKPVKVLTEN